ncbi:step II splicing factor, partial [Plasmodium cynomolgi strain B]
MNTKNVTREEKKKEKELNEARKAGKIEALKDEEGNDINPHMPQYIIKAPWYLNQTKPGLKHQRYKGTDKVKIEEERNKRVYVKNLKHVSDFCKNCGSATHKEKDCLERTRKKKLNFAKRDDEEDYVCLTQDLGYDGNRDRWVGYNADNFEHVYKEYEKIVEEKKKRKAEELKQKYERKATTGKKRRGEEAGGGDGRNEAGGGEANDQSGSDSENEEDDAGLEDDADLEDDAPKAASGANDPQKSNAKGSEKHRNVARNLRIREDTAKYLYNLSLNSAFYDPKSRSMREDPFATTRKNLPEDSNHYKGENYYNNTDEAIESKKLEIFAWETYKRGENVHFNAQPTQLELLYREFLAKKKKLIKKKEEHILKTYKCENVVCKDGALGEELSQSEIYTEYKPVDQIDPKVKRIKILSRYEEDVHLFEHSSVFGSYYDREKKKWGYR